jgi:hypothetical protein
MVLQIFVASCDCGQRTANFYTLYDCQTIDMPADFLEQHPEYAGKKERKRKWVARKYRGAECGGCFKKFKRSEFGRTWDIVAVDSEEVNAMMDSGAGGAVVLGYRNHSDIQGAKGLRAAIRRRMNLFRLQRGW